jgi:uncharacterized protein YggE
MKHKLMISIILVLAVVGLTACGSNVTPAADSSSQTLSINGTGVVYLSPDMATINLGVMTEGSDVKAATAESSAVIEKIKQVLEEYGVDPADVQTTNFSVYPMSDYGIELESTGLRYRVDNSVNVTVRELDQLGEVLDAVIVAGANSIYGIQFGLIDPEDAYTQAMQAAVENAQQRAEALATAASGELGEIQTISTYYGSGGVPVMYMAADSARPQGGGGSDVPVSAGALEVRVEVNLIYGLE